jgi:hypothetical protein
LIEGADTTIYWIRQGGDYYATVIDTEGCEGVSNEDSYIITSLDDNWLSKETLLYPNPNNGVFTIRFGEVEVTEWEIQIMNTSGETIHQQVGGFANEAKVNLPLLPSGVYYIKITTDKGSTMKQMVKRGR